jgi:hypothetical protein
MNLLLFIIALIVSFIVGRVGAIAFQLTGLEWSLARFQSLSCFTGTGFTTKEAELITASYQRRRIATTLMILGHAGLVALIATFANSINPASMATGTKIPFLSKVVPPPLLAAVNLLIIVAAVYGIFRVFTRTRFAHRITEFLRERVARKEIISAVSFEELAVVTGGYGVSKIQVSNQSTLQNRSIQDSGLRSKDITILAVVRSGETIPNPTAGTRIQLDDQLICFGKLENIREVNRATSGDEPPENDTVEASNNV